MLNLLNWPLTWYVPGMGMTPEKLSGYTYGLYMNGASPRIAKGRVPKRQELIDSLPGARLDIGSPDE